MSVNGGIFRETVEALEQKRTQQIFVSNCPGEADGERLYAIETHMVESIVIPENIVRRLVAAIAEDLAKRPKTENQ